MPPKTEFARHGNGMLLYLAGVFLFAANDALGKLLVAHYSVWQLLFVRSIGGLAVMMPIAWRLGIGFRLKGDWGLHLLRVILQTGDSFCFYLATWFLPLADVMTFYMAAPIILTAISALALGEKVGPYRWSAVVVGFVGVLIALAPTGDAFNAGSVIALAGATFFAVSMAITRKLRDSHPLPLVTWQFIGSGMVGAAISPFAWVMPGAVDLGLMLVLGAVAAGCFLLITRAVALAPASLLAPFQYSAVLWAALFGWAIWLDMPTPRIIAGNAILIASGLFVFYRERRLAVTVSSDTVEQIP